MLRRNGESGGAVIETFILAAVIGFAIAFSRRTARAWLAAFAAMAATFGWAYAMTEQEWDKLAATAGTAAVIGFGFGLASGYLVRKYHTFGEWLRGLVAAIVVAVLVGLGIDDTGWSVTMRSTIIAIAAFLAPDILEGLLQLAQMLKADPIGFFRRVRAALRGSPDEPLRLPDVQQRRADDPPPPAPTPPPPPPPPPAPPSAPPPPPAAPPSGGGFAPPSSSSGNPGV